MSVFSHIRIHDYCIAVTGCALFFTYFQLPITAVLPVLCDGRRQSLHTLSLLFFFHFFYVVARGLNLRPHFLCGRVGDQFSF